MSPVLPSITQRLTTLNLLVSAGALLLACVALGAYDRTSSYRSLEQHLAIQAQIAGLNSVSAIIFDDPSAAETTLRALGAAPDVLGAGIYKPNGSLFASYRREANGYMPPAPTSPGGYEVVNNRVVLTRPIAFDGKNIGDVVIASSLDTVMARRNAYILLMALVLAGALAAAWFISRIAQRSISAPIVGLAEVARAVSANKDYSLRARLAPHAHETSVLTASFNEMLDQIAGRDRALQAAYDDLERRVEARTAELDIANRELEAFSYSVSHDLRAPLRHVTGFSQLVLERCGPLLDDQGKKHLNTIIASARRMAQLIDDLLSFSRMSRTPLTKRPLDLGRLFNDAQHDVMADGIVNGRRIDWRIQNLPEVQADPAMLRLALLNLLSNAVKYTANRDVAEIEIGTAEGGAAEVVVFIRDNGVGFDMEYAHKLFGVFQRLHHANEFEGTGIGLANVKRIIQRHGGRVWATGTVNRGATFYFSLPVEARRR